MSEKNTGRTYLLCQMFPPIIARVLIGVSPPAVDNGYRIEWDRNPDGRDVINLTSVLGYNLCKVSDLVLDTEQMNGARILVEGYESEPLPNHDFVINGVTGLTGVFTNAGFPMIISGMAGSYSYNGIPVSVPSDGTYFWYGDDLLALDGLYKSAVRLLSFDGYALQDSNGLYLIPKEG